ncbi:MAG: WYL domain-containing protein [Bacilli bacterium]|nr:WYL domain-containing protein [Bacilli bacterium]
MSKLSNVLLMLSYLQNGRKYSINELSKKLEISPRMVRTYKEDLEKAGFIIDTIHGPYGGYILKKNSLSISSMFNEYDLNMLKKIQLNNQYVSSLIDRVQMIVNSNSDKIITSDIQQTYNVLSRAIKEKRKVKIVYDSLDKGLNERIVHPLELFYLENGFGIAAFCERKKDLRHFELKRIKKIEILKETY